MAGMASRRQEKSSVKNCIFALDLEEDRIRICRRIGRVVRFFGVA